jgi:orotate phosphoribosyltransferase
MIQDDFLALMLDAGVLTFGEFKTKSGRMSPFFFNMGALDSGAKMARAAKLYASAMTEHFGTGFDNVFGPAYKAIPLAVAAAQQVAVDQKRDVSFTFNRKEAKDHGEGGLFVGRSYAGGERVVIVEDVLTGGTSFRETMALMRTTKARVVGAVIGLDREERGEGTLLARAEIAARFGFPIHAILTLSDVIEKLHNKEFAGKIWIDDNLKRKIDDYRAQYAGR